MVKKNENTERIVKGDKLRDLILLVHLNNKYGKDKNEISTLKKILGYSTGGIYHALDNSGYFNKTPNEIQLTEKGEKYLNKKILPRYSIFNSIGNAFIILGFISILQWISWTYFQHAWINPWYSGLSLIVGGFILRFFILRLQYWVTNRKKKITIP